MKQSAIAYLVYTQMDFVGMFVSLPYFHNSLK